MRFLSTYIVVYVCCTLQGALDGKLRALGRYKTGIVRIHNHYRKGEHASNMKIMVWDAYLARRAAEWSENCYWGHQKRGLGENLGYYWSTGNVKMSDVIIKSIKSWYNEKYIWQWSTHCGAACHYTQMVWANTTRIGCAYSVCNLRTSTSTINNAHYLVCFYDPPGNYYGQYPYIYGRRCAKCSKDELCNQNLCCPKANSPRRQSKRKRKVYHDS